MLSSRNIVNNGYALAQGLGFTTADRLCLCVPLFHCFGCVIGVLGAFSHGACLCPVESFDARRVLETVERERCTTLYGVPTMFLAELEDPEFDRFDLTSLRTGIMAGALCPEPLMRRVIDRMHLPELTICYGLTETSPGLTQTPRDASLAERTQTVGKVMPEIEVRIVDPASGDEVADRLARRVVGARLRRDEGLLPHARADRRGDHAGRLAAQRRRGVDRRRRQRADHRAHQGSDHPRRREHCAQGDRGRHPAAPAVSDVSVYAVTSEFFGEEVAAAVRPQAGATIDAADIAEFCKARLARFKVPRFIKSVDAFPMTASGKIQKYRLREQHEAELRSAGTTAAPPRSAAGPITRRLPGGRSRPRTPSASSVNRRLSTVDRLLQTSTSTTRRLRAQCFSIFDGVIHFRPSFSLIVPVTVALISSMHASPDFSATSFLVTSYSVLAPFASATMSTSWHSWASAFFSAHLAHSSVPLRVSSANAASRIPAIDRASTAAARTNIRLFISSPPRVPPSFVLGAGPASAASRVTRNESAAVKAGGGE